MAIASGTTAAQGNNNIVLGAYFVTGNTTTVKAYFMDTLRRLVNASTYWQVDVQDVTGSATEALVLKPDPSKSQTPWQRIVVTMNVSGAAGGSGAAGVGNSAVIMANRTAGTADTSQNNNLYMGLSPDISPNKTWVTGSWNSDRPWGTSVRWSKYWSILDASTAIVDQMYLIESQETLLIGSKGRKGSIDHFWGYAGAIIQSADSGSGEQVTGSTGRVYGMSTNGTTLTLGTTFLGAATNGLFGHTPGTALGTHTGVFIVSGGVANTQGTGSNDNYFELCNRGVTAAPTAVSDTSGDRSTNVTPGETLVGWPIPIVSLAAPIRMLGFARQVYIINDVPALLPIATGTNNPVVIGYSWGADVTVANDSLMFSNI